MIILSNIDFWFMVGIILCLIAIIVVQAKAISELSDEVDSIEEILEIMLGKVEYDEDEEE